MAADRMQGRTVSEPEGGAIRVAQIVCIHPPRSGMHAGVTGPERRAANLICQWRDVGIMPVVFYPRRGRLWQHFASSGEELVDFEFSGKLDIIGALRLARLLRERAIGLAHTQGSPAIDLLVALAARKSGVPHILTRPAIIEEQANHPVLRRLLYAQIDRCITLKMARRIIAVSTQGYGHLRGHTGVKEESLVLIQNGVNLANFHYRSPTLATGDGNEPPIVIGMVGQLYAPKRWFDFLTVIERLHGSGLNVRALIVGEGELRGELESHVRRGLTTIVEFTGFQGNIAACYQRMDIFLLTSRAEGLPVAVIEAMASGLPVVATDVGGLRDQVTSEVNGFLVPFGDIDMLARCCECLVREPALRAAMGKAARETAQTKFDEKRMLHAYAECYKAAIFGELDQAAHADRT